jgi:ABC-2 type transport system permease protein
MNTILHTLSVTWKEIQLIVRDRGGLAVLFLLPLLMGSLYGGINLQASGDEEAGILVDVNLVNQDQGDFGAAVASGLQEIAQLQVHVLDSAVEAEEEVAAGEVTAAIIIPADFSANIAAFPPNPSSIEVIIDPAEPQGASIVTGIMNQAVGEVTIWGEVQYGIRAILDASGLFADVGEEAQRAVAAQSLGIVMTRLNELRQDPAIVVASEDVEGGKVENWIFLFFAYMFPGLTVMFAFFIVGMASASLLQEREVGTLRRLMAAPISRGAIIVGKMLAYVLLVCLQVALLFAVAGIFFDMPLGQSPAGLVLLTIVLGLVATALAMLVAAFAKTSQQADSLGMILGFVLAGIGGSIAMGAEPMSRSGGFMGVLSQLTPHAHAVEGYYSLMAENATLLQIMPRIGALLAMAVVFVGVAVWRFRFE